MSVTSIKKRKQNILKKGSINIKIKKLLIVRIHDNIKPIPEFAAHPATPPPSVCELEQLLIERLQIIKAKIIFEQLSS